MALRCRKQALGQIKPMGAAGLRERASEFVAFYTNNVRAHFRAEEEVLFPALRAALPEIGLVIDELIRDHAAPAESIGASLEKILAGGDAR